MRGKVLITGGAGFVGSHLADELLAQGYEVRALDALFPQVHGGGGRPDYLSDEVELIRGDLRESDTVRRALRGVEAVVHLAAAVGVGQSMYQIAHYTNVNGGGTAVLLEALARRPVRRLVVASSMSVYGEGMYRSRSGVCFEGEERTIEALKARQWEVRGPDGEPATPVPTPEEKTPSLPNVYALSKYHQERLCLTVGRAYGLPVAALRFFNIYGARQALSNPYTGVLAIFASRYLNGRRPLIHEDGWQRRDFVSVRDAARACRLALERPEAEGRVFNIGSDRHHAIREVAELLAVTLGREELVPEVTGRARLGDIRSCVADISLARRLLGYEPQVALEQGLCELAEWLEGKSSIDRMDDAARELSERRLIL